jgi:hypothetical protein
MWVPNAMRNPRINLQNADDFYIPPHQYESLKRLPLFTLPKLWNEQDIRKYNQNRSQFLKSFKSETIADLN